LSEVRAATDASIRIDGQAVTSGSNTISDAIEGVTVELTASDPGVLRNVSVGYDRAALTGKLEEFVAAYNTLLETFDNETRFNAETNEAGPLLGDSTLRGIRDQLRRSFGDALADTTAPARTLSDIGISITVEGRAELDTEKLESFLDTGFTAVGTLFTAEDGVAVRLDALVAGYLDSDSALETRTSGLEATIDDIGEQREALQQRLLTLEERLLRQFNALDRLVSELTNTSNFLAQQLSQLPGAGNGN
ncbi:MAG: flagellar filament capping protein FliD, partial [Pseudomonadota bacterium]